MAETTEAKYSLSIPLPKRDQWEASRTITIRADHSEELKNSVDNLLGAGTFDRLMAQAVQATFPPEPAPPQASPAVTPVAAGPSATAPVGGAAPQSVQSNAACPSCGIGQMIWKQRKDGTGSFLACSNFPNCKYIAGNR